MIYGKQLKILFLEDLEADKQLADRELKNSGLIFSSIRVETKEELQAQVIKFAPDIIISDYSLPKYNGMQALRFIKENYPSLPFILFTGSINEETAVECMKTGADDYIIKEHLTRLPFAVRDVLKKFDALNEKREFQKALIESEDRFRDLVENSSDLICTHDQDGNLLSVNKAAVNVTGYTEKELLKMNMQDILVPEYKRIFNAYLKKIYVTGKANGFMTIQTKTGERRIWEYNNTLRTKGVTKPIVRGMVKDITEQKHAEEKRRESELRFRLVWEKATDGMRLTNEEGIVVLTNNAYCKMVEKPREEIEGKPLSIVYEEARQAEILRKHQERFRSQIIPAHLERELVLWNGKRIFLELSNTFLENPHQPTLSLSVFKNITERKLAEAALHDSREDLYRLLNSIAEGAYGVDTNGNCTFVNRSFLQILGYRNDNEVLGKHIHELIHHSHSDGSPYPSSECKIYCSHQINQNINVTDEVFWRKGGIAIPVEYWSHPIIKSGVVIGSIATFIDITERKRAEEEIKMLAFAMRSVNECVSITDLEDRIIFVNESFKKTYGYTDAELIGKNMLIVRSPNNPPEVVSEILPATLSGGWKGEILNRKKDGSEFPISLSTTIVRDKVNKPIALIGVARDITERRSIEKALIESEKDYRNLFEQANDAIIIFRPANEIIIEVNNKACELYGFKKEEMIGMSFKKLTKDTLKGEKKIKDLFLLKKIQNYETIQNRKDGTPIYVSVNASLINYKNEEVIQSINRDITQNTKNIEALRVSENKYRTIFQTANEGICVVDVNDKIVSVNDKLVKMLGFSEDEFCKLYYEDIISSTDVTRQRKMYFDQKDGKVNSYERRLQCKDGTNIWALITVSPILSKTGAYQGAFGMFADITEQKKMIYELVSAKEKAEEMNKVKSSFFANMSHELRTPFVGIIGFAEIIKETAADTEIAQMADGIVQSSKRMTATLNNILDLTKLEYGNLELYFEHVNVEGLIDEVYHSFLNDAAIKGLSFEKTVSGFTAPVNSDRSLLRSILTGFVSNAVKYTRHGKIEILADRRIRDEQEFLVIQISDTGIGIAKETQVIIWNEFRQASEGLNRNFEGTGLGLTLCKKYVELLNGKIYLQSEVGVGSTFTAEIPVTSVAFETSNGITISDAHENIHFENAGTLPNKKILYIDDDPLSLEVVGRYLSNEFSVECVSRIPQFLEKLKEAAFDCILMDINLGGEISGINLIKEVKRIEKYYNTPVVAITAYALKSDEELILSKEFSHYISKPFEKKDMLNLLKRIFAEK